MRHPQHSRTSNAVKYLSFDLTRLRNSDTWAEAHKHPWLGLACLNLWCSAAERDGAGLPDDDDTLSRLAGVKPQIWSVIKTRALKAWRLDDGRWFHSLVEAEAQRYQKAVESGKKGAKARHNKNNDLPRPPTRPTNGVATRDPTRVASRDPTGTPLPIVQSSQKPSSHELASVAARELPLDRFARLLKLDLSALHKRPQFQGFPGIFHEWKLAGCEPETDIWPTIERLAARGQTVESPKYFTPAIMRARDDRIAALPSEAERWATRISAFKLEGFWAPEWGPKPGEDGCQVVAA